MKQINLFNKFFFKKTLEEERCKYCRFKKLLGLYPEINERIVNAKTLIQLLELHKRAFQEGFRNINLNVCDYGMFRATSIASMEPENVFLGNIYGLFTKPIPEWEKAKDELYGINSFNIPRDTKIYDLIVRQYRKVLTSNIDAIKNEAIHFIKEYERLNKVSDPFKLK